MSQNADVDQLIVRYVKYMAIPEVIVLCVWVLFLKVPSASLTAFIAVSGVIVGTTTMIALGSRTRNLMVNSDDPESVIKKRVTVFASAAIIAICLAGIVTMVLSNGV